MTEADTPNTTRPTDAAWAAERWGREVNHFADTLGLLVHVMEADEEIPGGFLRPITNAFAETQEYLYQTRNLVNQRIAELEAEVARLTTGARS